MLQLILFLVPPLNIQLTTPYKFIPISPCRRFKWVQLFFGSMPSLHILLCISYINFGVSPEIERIFEKLLHLVMQFPPFAFAHISLSLFLTPCLRMMMMKSYVVPFAFFFFLFLLSCDLYLRKLNCSETGLWWFHETGILLLLWDNFWFSLIFFWDIINFF